MTPSSKAQTILNGVEEARKNGLSHIRLKMQSPDESLFRELRENELLVEYRGDGEYVVTWK